MSRELLATILRYTSLMLLCLQPLFRKRRRDKLEKRLNRAEEEFETKKEERNATRN